MKINLDKYPLDGEIVDYLQTCASRYPDDNSRLTVAENRRLYLQMCALFDYPTPDGVTIENHSIPGRQGRIAVRHYLPEGWRAGTTVVYYHGGGFVVGDLDSHDSVCADLADQCGCRVVAVDYRLSPETRHPAAFEDALDAFAAINNDSTIVAGDSAGGTLAAAVSVATRESVSRPIGQILIYPWLGGELFDLDSYRRNSDAPGLTTGDLEDYRRLRSNHDQDHSDPTYYPLALGDFSSMPPCYAFAAEFDPLHDDAVEYVRRLTQVGVHAQCVEGHGLVHAHLRGRRVSAKAGAAFESICQAVSALADRSDQEPDASGVLNA